MRPALPNWALTLIRCGNRDPSAGLMDRIAGLGEAARPVLLSLVRGEYAEDGEYPDEGWARVHAAGLLRPLGPDAESVRVLMDVLRVQEDDELLDRAIATLRAWGPSVAQPILDVFDTVPAEARGDFAHVLAGCGVKSDRILDVLIALVRSDGSRAFHLADYGDPAALPALRATLAATRFHDDALVMGNQEIIELADAIERLGGTLTAEERGKLDRVARRRRRATREFQEAIGLGAYARPGTASAAGRDLLDRARGGGTLRLTRPGG